ncbi:UNVERIFIED_CONTAM: hypothetical protein K2H54_049644 [Gekko kuhli]
MFVAFPTRDRNERKILLQRRFILVKGGGGIPPLDILPQVLTSSTMMSGIEGEEVLTTTDITTNPLVTEVPVTTVAPVTAAPVTYAPYLPGQPFPVFYTPSGLSQQGVKTIQSQMLPSPYPTFPLIPQGQLTQWSQFKPDSTAEMYVLTKGPRRDSRWDLPGPLVYQPIPGYGLGETSSVWTETRPRDREAPVEEQVELEDDEYKDEEDWGPRLAALEKGQQKIQRNLEDVMLTIPEIIVRAIRAEQEAEGQGEDQRPPP